MALLSHPVVVVLPLLAIASGKGGLVFCFLVFWPFLIGEWSGGGSFVFILGDFGPFLSAIPSFIFGGEWLFAVS